MKKKFFFSLIKPYKYIKRSLNYSYFIRLNLNSYILLKYREYHI
jgi:hypothetical protein